MNAHDHLHRNHLPRLGEPPYADAATWGRDLHERFAEDLERRHALPRREALLFGALKNVLGGATTAVHHDAWEDDFDRGLSRPRAAHPDRAVRARGAGGESRRCPGRCTSPRGRAARRCEEIADADARGLLGRSLAAVHLVAADADGLARLARAGCAAVWCPTSNAFLYGATASRALFGAGLEVLLGTDALVSGAGTLLDELAAARATGLVPDARLEAAVSHGRGAAARARRPVARGRARPPTSSRSARRSSPRGRATSRSSSSRGAPSSRTRSSPRVFDAAGVPHEPLTVGGVDKRVAAPLGVRRARGLRARARVPQNRRVTCPATSTGPPRPPARASSTRRSASAPAP